MKYLVKAILEIARENPEGFTVEIPSLEHVKEGIPVGYEATQDSFTAEDVESVVRHAMNHENIVGGWLNEEGEFQFDSCKIFFDLEEALEFAKRNNQRAIFDITNSREIRL